MLSLAWCSYEQEYYLRKEVMATTTKYTMSIRRRRNTKRIQNKRQKMTSNRVVVSSFFLLVLVVLLLNCDNGSKSSSSSSLIFDAATATATTSTTTTSTSTTILLRVDAFSIVSFRSKTSTPKTNTIIAGETAIIRTTKIPSSMLSALSSSSISVSNSKSISIPPPRFDVFAEQLVGSWFISSSSPGADFPSTTNTSTRSVEEVMRSCGGAVQGLREPFVMPEGEEDNNNNKSGNSEGLYLNRANDGFLFVNEGHYSYGPTTTTSTTCSSTSDDQPRPQQHFVSNFMLAKDCRVLLSSSKQQQQQSFLRKQKFGAQGQSIAIDDEAESLRWIDDPTRQISPTTIHDVVTCSMPSSSQTWMLQRSKWRKRTFQVEESYADEEEEEENRDENDGTTTIYCWSTSIQSLKEFWEWMDVSNDDSQQEEGAVQQMGIYCKDSGQFQISCRFYGSHGPGDGDGDETVGLSEVSWIRGTAELAIE